MKWIKILLFLGVFAFSREIEINFQNLDINDFIKMVAKITNKNILITQRLNGKVNFISVKPVNEKEVYNILLNILRSKGYTLIEDKGFLKVIRSSEAPREAPPLATDNSINQIETDIMSLKYISAREASLQISFLLSRYGKIVINKENNMLIITDYPRNLKSIKNILKRIDIQHKNIVKIYNFKNVDLDDIYSKITDIANIIYPSKIFKYKIIKNNNSIIIVGKKDIVDKIIQISINLDKKPQKTNLTTKIITLKNSDVNEMMKVIQNIIKQKYTSKDKISITADKETNSLIILGKPNQILTLEKVINSLDTPKQQVYVKARILEISNSKISQIGPQFGLIGGIADSSSGIYTLSANLGGPPLAFNPTDLGLSIPTIKQGIALGATLDLLETLGAAKKLSEPSILCINNTPSTIYVGKTLTVLTGKTTSTSTSESYSRQDVGLTLKVKPRIDSDNKVSLNVDAIIEDILPGSQTLTPITSKRTINTTTIVKNGQSIIIGGLVRNNNDITLSKVPLLSDIPFIGNLFKHKQLNKDKTTLVIMLTPYIVKKPSDLDKLRSTLSKLNLLEKQFAHQVVTKVKTINKKKKQESKPLYDFMGENYENDR